MCLAVGLPWQAIGLFVLLALGFAGDVVSTTSTGEHLVRKKREDETGCLVGEVATEFSDGQRLTDNGGTYLMQPQQMCSGCLAYLETCFFYSHTSLQNAPIFFSMQVGVFRKNDTLEEYQLQDTLQSISSVQHHDEERGCECHSLNPVPVEDGDVIGVLFENACNSTSWGPVCPLQPVSTSGEFCSVLYYNQSTASIPLDGLAARDHCLNVVVNVTANCTVKPSPVPKCSLTPGPHKPILTNSEIIRISFGGAGFLLITTVVFSVICYKIQKHRRHRNHSPSVEGERHSKRSKYRSIEDRIFGEESGEVDKSISRVRLSRKHRRAARALATPSSDDSRRHSFRNRGYADSNTYSLVGPIDSDSNSLVEFDGSAHHTAEDDGSEHHAAERITITASIAQSASGHYESTDTYEGTFWTPANQAEELRAQFKFLNLPEVPKEELQIKEWLGSGEFGKVRKGVWQSSTGETEVAVKCLAEGSTEKERIKFLQEAAIMGQFKHPNILTIFGIVTTLEPLMILCEVMIKGDLHRYLHSLKPMASGNTARDELTATFLSFCRQVAAGMSYLAHKSFVHRDLAARNILVSDADVCKIADFGLSRDLQDEEYYISSGGRVPVKWTAPEALTSRTYSTTSDVWSYGVLLYEIWALGTKPYHNSTNKETLKMILSGYRLPPPPGCPQSIYKLMLQCWHYEAQSRPTFFEILLALQRPDFQLLKWTSEDEAAYSEEARTVGSPTEAGEELYTELQQMYSHLDGGF